MARDRFGRLVAPVEYPKVRGRTALTFALFVVAGLVLIGVLRYLEVDWTFSLYRVLSVLAIVIVAAYVLLGPLVMSLRGPRVFED